MTAGEAPDDKAFKALPTLLDAREESTCMMRVCCGRNREFKMNMNGVNAQGQTFTYIILERPFKCTLNFMFCVLNPQEITVKNGVGAVIGTVVQDWRCFPAMCFPGFSFFYKVLGAANDVRWIVRMQYPTLCNGCHNLCAPTCFNKVFMIEIFNADESQQVGTMRAVWPGCSLRCLTDATNLIIDFPQGISGDDKAMLLGCMMLIEYNAFEKKQDQNSSY